MAGQRQGETVSRTARPSGQNRNGAAVSGRTLPSAIVRDLIADPFVGVGKQSAEPSVIDRTTKENR
jgi:hypothetical protein